MREPGRLAARPTAMRTALLLAAPLLPLLVACSGSDTAEDPEPAGSGAVTVDDLQGTWAEASAAKAGSGSTIWIRLDGSHLNASAGCNSFDGKAEIVDGRLEVHRLVSTAMGCADARGKREELLSTLLRASPTVALDRDSLVLTADDASLELAPVTERVRPDSGKDSNGVVGHSG